MSAAEPSLLLVDADEEAREALVPFLSRCGALRVATDLAQARAAAEESAPEVLVLDPALPDGDGLAWLAQLRARAPWVQTLALCGPGTTPAAVIAAGARDLAFKPFDVGTLRPRVALLSSAAQRLREELEQRRALEARVAHADRVRTLHAATATLAHELANPLTTVAANTAWLREELARGTLVLPEAREDFHDVVGALERATRLLEALVSRARNYTRQGERERRVGPLEEVLRWALELLASRVASRAVRVELPAESAPVAPHEPVALTQALVNVLGNALEAMEPGGRLTVRYLREGALVGLCVEDDGPGVTEQTLARMGEPFYSSKPGGTGLGLALVRQVLSEHGGRAEFARGEGGRGLRVRLLLPA